MSLRQGLGPLWPDSSGAFTYLVLAREPVKERLRVPERFRNSESVEGVIRDFATM